MRVHFQKVILMDTWARGQSVQARFFSKLRMRKHGDSGMGAFEIWCGEQYIVITTRNIDDLEANIACIIAI